MLLVAPLALAAPARTAAQLPGFEGIEAWADAIAGGLASAERGPRVEPPEPRARPRALGSRESLRAPVAVHAGSIASLALLGEALRALERVRGWLAAAGWPPPWPDGGRGGSGAFDLYLVPSLAVPARAGTDGPVVWATRDGEVPFAEVDATLTGDALEACVAFAYAEAVLLAVDPAEAPSWRRSTAEFLVRSVGGLAGCTDDPERHQEQPWRAWIDGPGGAEASGALLLAAISARHDRGTGRFVRDLWDAASQRTPAERSTLRGRPDLWEVLDGLLRLSRDPLPGIVEDVAVARWFAGDPARTRAAPMPLLTWAAPRAGPRPFARTTWAELPEHLPIAEDALEPFGSAYALVDVRTAPPGAVLRAWLHAEYGVRWSFVAVRLGRDGRAITELAAPHREEPRSYLVLELGADTADVLLVVTNLSCRVPDADGPDENVRSFKLILSSEAPS